MNMSLYQQLVDAGVEPYDIELKVGEGWTLEEIARDAKVCRCIDCGGNLHKHDDYCPYMKEMFGEPNSMSSLIELAERVAFRLSTRHVRECVRSLRGGQDDWQFKLNEAHRTRPYPMGFYDNDSNLYYAIGWGMHVHMLPWERWLVMRAKSRSSK